MESFEVLLPKKKSISKVKQAAIAFLFPRAYASSEYTFMLLKRWPTWKQNLKKERKRNTEVLWKTTTRTAADLAMADILRSEKLKIKVFQKKAFNTAKKS